MSFTKMNPVTKLKKGNEEVTIFKFKKDGTRRSFFAPEVNEKRINSTMFARLYDAENLAKRYLNR